MSTYKPSVTGEDRFESLYHQAQAKEYRLQEKRQEEVRYEQNNLFRPEITKKARDLARGGSSSAPGSPTNTRGGKAKFERLYHDHEIWRVHLQLLEKEAMRRLCGDRPFQPTLIARGPRDRSRQDDEEEEVEKEEEEGDEEEEDEEDNIRSSRRRRRRKSKSFGDRLYPTEEMVMERRMRMSRLKDQIELAGCTFQPVVNEDSPYIHGNSSNNNNMDGSPVYERLYGYMQARELKMELLKAARDNAENRELTFTPTLCSRPTSPVRDGTASGTPVYERLYARVPQIPEPAPDPECTFHPRLNSSPGRRRTINTPLEKRLEDFRHLKEMHLKQLQDRTEADNMRECTFQPHTNASPPRRRGGDEGYDDGDGEGQPEAPKPPGPAWYERISRHLQDLDSWREKQKEKRDLDGCTFKPQTNANPDYIHSNRAKTPVAERLYSESEAIHKRLQKRKDDEERKALSECTFMPKVNPRAKRVAGRIREKHNYSRQTSSSLNRTLSRQDSSVGNMSSSASITSSINNGGFATLRRTQAQEAMMVMMARTQQQQQQHMMMTMMQGTSAMGGGATLHRSHSRTQSVSSLQSSIGGGTLDRSRQQADLNRTAWMSPAYQTDVRREDQRSLSSPRLHGGSPSSPKARDLHTSIIIGDGSAPAATPSPSSSSASVASPRASVLSTSPPRQRQPVMAFASEGASAPGERMQRYEAWRTGIEAQVKDL